MTPYQTKIVDWMRANSPREFVTLSGVQLQASRGLEKSGFVEIVGVPGKYSMRLTDKGRRDG